MKVSIDKKRVKQIFIGRHML